MSEIPFVKAFPQGSIIGADGTYLVGSMTPGDSLSTKIGVCQDCSALKPSQKAACNSLTQNWTVGEPLPTNPSSPCFPIDINLGPFVRKAGWLSKNNCSAYSGRTSNGMHCWTSVPAILFCEIIPNSSKPCFPRSQ